MSFAYICLDESGCLGFDFSKKATSKHFLITMLFSNNHRHIEKCVKSVRQGLSAKITTPLHCHKEKPITRQRLLKKLSEKECKIMTIVLEKTRVYTSLQNEQPVLYNYVTNILLDRIFSKKILGDVSSIHLVASQKETSKFLNLNFQNYLKQNLEKHGVDLKISIKTPHQEIGLQAVDFVSWAIFRKYERNDDSYYKLIEKLIYEENYLFR